MLKLLVEIQQALFQAFSSTGPPDLRLKLGVYCARVAELRTLVTFLLPSAKFSSAGV